MMLLRRPSPNAFHRSIGIVLRMILPALLLLAFPSQTTSAVSVSRPLAQIPDVAEAYAWEGVAQQAFFADTNGTRIGSFQAVAIDGDTLVVGKRGANQAYVFTRTPGAPAGWAQQAILKPEAPLYAGVDFGTSLAINGDLIAVGEPEARVSEQTGRGAIYLFARDAGGPNAWGQIARIVAPEAIFIRQFGAALALSPTHLVIGAPESRVDDRNVAGFVYIYTRGANGPNDWRWTARLRSGVNQSNDRFGATVALAGDTLAVGAPNIDNARGAVEVFQYNGAQWAAESRIMPADLEPNTFFGSEFALAGDQLLVGQATKDRAILFARNQGGPQAWEEVARLTDDDPTTGSGFGRAVAIQGDRLFIGAPATRSTTATQHGAIYVFAPNDVGDQWEPITRITPPDSKTSSLGAHLAVSGADLISHTGNGTALDDGPIFAHRLFLRPTPAADQAETAEDQSVTIDVLANDTAPAAAGALNPGAVTITTPPTHGSAAVDPLTGAITYTPNLNYVGADQLRYRAVTTFGSSRTAAVSISVAPVNDPPTFDSTPVTAAQAASVYIYEISTDDIDAGDTLQISAPTAPGWLALQDYGDGTATLSGTPTDADVGEHPIELEVVDSGGLRATQAFTISVAPNRAPFFVSQPPTGAREGLMYAYRLNARDPDAGQALNFSISAAPAWLTLTQESATSAWLSGVPATSDVGEFQVRLTATDPGGLQATQAFTLTVAADAPAAPTDLRAVAIDQSRIRLTWRDQSATELGFRVERRDGEGEWRLLSELPANTTTYEDTLLACGMSYSYRVSAFNDRWASDVAESTGAAEQTRRDTFKLPAAPLPINPSGQTNAQIIIAEIARVVDVDVQVSLDHPYVADLSLILVAPNGEQVVLSAQNGAPGQHYRNTVFDDAAPTGITSGRAPFQGTYRPQLPLAELNGLTLTGAWELQIINRNGGFAGTLHDFTLHVTRTNGCPNQPPAPSLTPTLTFTPTPTATPTPTYTATPTVRPPTVWYVHSAAVGAANGLTWADAFTDLQTALGVVRAGDSIWVAQGVYRPTTGDDRRVRFDVPAGVSLYGGFAGFENSLDQRDWQEYATILSGDIGAQGLPDDNSHVIVSLTNAPESATFDGFVISEGGTGMLLSASHLTLRNLILRNNNSEVFGGGIDMHESRPKLSDILFLQNVGARGGGGMYIRSTKGIVQLERVQFVENRGRHGGGMNLSGSQVTLRDVVFERNRATGPYGQGGAIYSWSSVLTVEDSRFHQNTALYGGAIYHQFQSAHLHRLQFTENTADGDGGAIALLGGRTTVTDSDFFANATTGLYGNGGALRIDNDANVTVNGATFGGNRSNFRGGAIAIERGNLTLMNAVIVGNQAGEHGGGIYNCGNQHISNSTIVFNSSVGRGGGLMICWPGWPVINSIFWGNTSGAGGSQVDSPRSAVAVVAEHSLIAGGYTGTAILDADPAFVNPAGPDGIYGTPDDDLRLRADSPAIDAGNSALVRAEAFADRDGNQRRADDPAVPDTGLGAPVVDLGAYERLALIAPTLTPTATVTPTPSRTPTMTPTPTPAFSSVIRVTSSADTGDGELSEGEVTGAAIHSLGVTFTRTIHEYLRGAVLIIGEGATPGIQTQSCADISPDDQFYFVNFMSYQYTTQSITYGFGTPNGAGLPSGAYRLIICDTITASDPRLDGDGDGMPGGDFVRNFTIDRGQPLPTATPTPTATATPTATLTPTATATSIPTATTTPTVSATYTPTPSLTATTVVPPEPTSTATAAPQVMRITPSDGRPGSAFTLSGSGLTASSALEIRINGTLAGMITADTGGAFRVALQTSADASTGEYRVTLTTSSTASATPLLEARYTLRMAAPLRSGSEAGAPTIQVPVTIQPNDYHVIWVPLLSRR